MLSNMLGFLVQSQYQNNCRGDVYQGAGVLTSSPLSVCRSWVLTQVKGWFSVWFSWVKACLAEQGRCPQILSFGSKVEDCHWVIVKFSGKILRFRWFWRDLEGFWQVNRGRPSVSFPAPPGFVRVFPTGAGAVTCQVFLFGVGGGWIVCRWSRESMAINVLFIYIYIYISIYQIYQDDSRCLRVWIPSTTDYYRWSSVSSFGVKVSFYSRSKSMLLFVCQIPNLTSVGWHSRF